MAELLFSGVVSKIVLRLTSSLITAGLKWVQGDRVEASVDVDIETLKWSGDVVFQASGKSSEWEQLRQEMMTASGQVEEMQRNLERVHRAVRHYHAENMQFLDRLHQKLEATEQRLVNMQRSQLESAKLDLLYYRRGRGDTYLERAHRSALATLTQGDGLDLPARCIAGAIAVAAGYVFDSKAQSPAEAKVTAVDVTVAYIISKLKYIWNDPLFFDTGDGRKTLHFLVDLVSSVSALPPREQPVLPRVDRELREVLGLLCAREPVLRTRYANVGGELVKPLLMQKSWWELVQLAGFIDVDITRCEQRADIIQALIKFPGPLVSDMDGLMYLYEDTGGSSWRNSSNWGSSRPLREWYGVRTNDAGRAVELRLQNEKLRGHIPAPITLLNALEYLLLNNLQKDEETINKLAGPIPSEFGRFLSLLRLSLRNNCLTGPIPPELGRLRHLEDLDLAGNLLTGIIPSSLGNLSTLRTLDLGRNNLVGPIPPSLGQLRLLTHLSLSSCHLSDVIPLELFNLVALEELYLNDNNLSGPIPERLANLRMLQVLWLQHNELAGVIPQELSILSVLRHLRLEGNRFGGGRSEVQKFLPRCVTSV